MRNIKIKNQRRFIISGKYDEYYYTEEIDSMTPDDTFDLHESNIQDVYNLYDELTRNNNSMQKKLLGYGANIKGVEDSSLPIYEYIIYPPETTQKTHGDSGHTDLFTAPTILITTGVHGNEKSAVYGAYEFVKQLVQNPQNSRGLYDLKSNFQFRVIPIVNPGGYNKKYRNTLSEVDLNRNFSYRWDENDHISKGSQPYSEIEAKILGSWLAKNKNAFAYVDYHNFTRIGESIGMPERKIEMTSYHLSPNQELDRMYSSLIRRASNEWKSRYLQNFSNLENGAFGFIYSDKRREIPTTISEAYYTYDISLASIPEITYNDPKNPEVFYTKTVMELSAEFFINYILTLVDCFKDH